MRVAALLLGVVPSALAQRLDFAPLTRRLAHGAGWSLLGAVVSRALVAPIGILLARSMGREQFGELAIIYSSVELFAVFGGFGLGVTAVKHIAEFRSKDPVRAGRIIALSTLMMMLTAGTVGLVLFAFARWLASDALAAPHLAGPLRIAALLLFFNLVTQVQMASLSGFEAFKVVTRLQLLSGLIDLPLLLVGYSIAGLPGVLWGAVVSRVALCFLCRRALLVEARQAGVPVSLDLHRQDLSMLLNFSLPSLISGILVAPVNWLCATMLVNQSDGYREMGAYNAANQWYTLIVFAPMAMANGILPLLSDRLSNRDLHASRTVFRLIVRVNAAIALPIAVGASLFSPYVMAVYGHEYRDAWPTLIAVVLTGTLFVVLAPVGDVLAASGRMWVGCLMNFAWAVAFVVMAVLLVRFGSVGLATARLGAYCLHAGWVLWFVFRVLRPQWAPGEHLRDG
jgi:O-antigen/teichoic acid export membrane protein